MNDILEDAGIPARELYEPRIEVKIGNGVVRIMAESRQWQQVAELIRWPARNFYRLDVRLVSADAKPSEVGLVSSTPYMAHERQLWLKRPTSGERLREGLPL